MTVLSRGARVRRGGRRPGWLLLTTLLVLAIGASSALVFTDRVELLKLAVILALWAAVVAAFVSVIYRRQSDVDQARVRDLKLVYDLQLDREISARREYELTVESQLRRELASELRAQAADEVAALRTELAALRTNLEVLFETELDQRPALETERAAQRSLSEWSGSGESAPADWVASNRVTSVRAETVPSRAEETAIIDVPEEPVPRQPTAGAARRDEVYEVPEQVQRTEVYSAAAAYPGAEAYRGSHWRPAEDDRPVQERQNSRRRRYTRSPDAEVPNEHRGAGPHAQPAAHSEPQRAEMYPPVDADAPRAGGAAAGWQPAAPDGRRTPGADTANNRTAAQTDEDSPKTDPRLNGLKPVGQPPPEPLPEPFQPLDPPAAAVAPRRGRHSSADDVDPDTLRPGNGAPQPRSARHSVERPDLEAAAAAYQPPTQAPAASSPSAHPVARHRSAEELEDDDAPPTGGHSAADLLARFQVEPAGGGRRRRRRED